MTAVHGNEILPTLALASVGKEQVVANPRALSQGVRFVERDLNASFGTEGNSYEEKRACELMKLIDPKSLVIDFHTFSCESEPFAIIVDLDMIPLASSLGLKYVVYMKHNIKAGHALINHRDGVSIEVGGHSEERSFENTLKILERLENDEIHPEKVRVFEVYDRIKEKGDYKNFIEKYGVVPVLYGERAYPGQGYYGLLAREITGTII